MAAVVNKSRIRLRLPQIIIAQAGSRSISHFLSESELPGAVLCFRTCLTRPLLHPQLAATHQALHNLPNLTAAPKQPERQTFPHLATTLPSYTPLLPTMSTLEAPSIATTNGFTVSDSPVPLDTIPISPAKDATDTNNDAMRANEAASKAKDGDDRITVFHDAENFNVKHPLMHEWTLWFTKPPSGKVGFMSCYLV